MKVVLAESAGFCFGVKRAMKSVYDEIDKANGGKIYTYGPIIHNEEVVRDLENKGVTVIHSYEELDKISEGTIIIRSHGISRTEKNKMEERGLTIVDCTCPFVLKIHRIVEEYSNKGYHIVIVGNENHPEVQGIRGWVAEKATVTILNGMEEARAFSCEKDVPICLVAQTTFNYNKFQELVEIVNEKGYDISVLNTICNATEERQTEARKIARESEAMIVIGGKSSSNTQKLFEICKKECENTYYIQTSNDMDYSKLKSINNVGITAGASTPNNIIEEVSKNVRNEL